MSEANKKVVRRFIEEGAAKNDHRVIDETLSPNFVHHNPIPGVPGNAEGIKMGIAAFRQAFPDYRLAIMDLVAEGDKVASRIRFTGTHKGELMGMPPTGKSVQTEFWHIERIANGRIAERWSLFDQWGLMQQLGAVPGGP